MDEKQGLALLEKWQGLLELRDWTIALRVGCLPDEMRTPEVDGEADWTECRKTAVIRLLDERCYGERIVPYHPERTLIHELLHLKLCLLGESGNALQDRLAHQLIDDLADAKESWIAACLADGVPVPEPARLEDYSGQFKLRLPKSLHRALSLRSSEEGVSMNQLCLYLLSKGLHA